MKKFEELCCHKENIDGIECDFINKDVEINYHSVFTMSCVFSQVAMYCVENFKTDGYYDVARAAWEYENNGIVRIFARQSGIDCDWRYDFYEKEGFKSALECAKNHLGCDVEIVVTKQDSGKANIDIYVRSKAEYLRKYKFDNIDSPTSSFVNSLRCFGFKVTHHKLEE